MKKLRQFADGIQSLTSSLVNSRQIANTREIKSKRIPYQLLNQCYKTGVGGRIITIKANTALKDPMKFEDESYQKIYNKHLSKVVMIATEWMLTFGRGIVVIIEKNKTLDEPLVGKASLENTRFQVFDGSLVSVTSYETDLMSERYNKPEYFQVRGYNIHHSRVVDFKYIEPTEEDSSLYNWGGISEFERIYEQLLNDSTIETASANIIEKNSTIFYRIDGFKQALQMKKEDDIVRFFGAVEDARSMYGAGIIDKNDEIVEVSQSLGNLDKVDEISLRRLTMVTGIPMAYLVGENVQGLNSSGTTETSAFKATIENLQERFIIGRVNELTEKIGLGCVEFDRAEALTPFEQAEFDSKILDNAKKLYDMAEDYVSYLKLYNVIKEDDAKKIFSIFDIEDDEDYKTEEITNETPENQNSPIE